MQPEKIFIHDENEIRHDLFDLDDFRVGYFISKNLSKSNDQDNEDILFLTKDKKKLTLGVSDGAGGHPRGRDAAFEVGKELKNIDDNSILEKLEKANNKILELKVGAKSTAAVAQVNGMMISFHLVGDSEIVYWNAQGRELYASTPHSPAGHKVAAGVSTQAESLDDPERHMVMSLMGDDFIKIQSTSNFELKKGHTILVGSDGLFDNISHEDLTELIGKGSFDQSFNELVKICSEQKEGEWLKEDDISFIALRKVKANES